MKAFTIISFIIFFYTWIVIPSFMLWVYFTLMGGNPMVLLQFVVVIFLLDRISTILLNCMIAWIVDLKTKMIARIVDLKTKMIAKIFG